jgi:hypothetical protein
MRQGGGHRSVEVVANRGALMSAQRMSNADAAWLHMDRPTNLMVVNALLLFDEPVDADRVKEILRSCLVEPSRDRRPPDQARHARKARDSRQANLARHARQARHGRPGGRPGQAGPLGQRTRARRGRTGARPVTTRSLSVPEGKIAVPGTAVRKNVLQLIQFGAETRPIRDVPTDPGAGRSVRFSPAAGGPRPSGTNFISLEERGGDEVANWLRAEGELATA